MREFIVDLTNAQTIEDFVAAFNDGFCRRVGGEWKGQSLDAFNDYLSWPDEEEYRLIMRDWKRFSAIISRIRFSETQSYLEVIEEIFRSNPSVEIVLA